MGLDFLSRLPELNQKEAGINQAIINTPANDAQQVSSPVPVGQPDGTTTSPATSPNRGASAPMFSSGQTFDAGDLTNNLTNVTVPPEIAGTEYRFGPFARSSISAVSAKDLPPAANSLEEEIATLKELGIEVDEKTLAAFSPEAHKTLQTRQSSTLEQACNDAGVKAPTRESIKNLLDKVRSGTPLSAEEAATLKKQEDILKKDCEYNANNRGQKSAFAELPLESKINAANFLKEEVASGNTTTFNSDTSGLDSKTNASLENFAIQNGAKKVEE